MVFSLEIYTKNFKFTTHRRLTELALTHNAISVLPEKVFQDLTSLRKLHLAKNRIGRLLQVHFKGNNGN